MGTRLRLRKRLRKLCSRPTSDNNATQLQPQDAGDAKGVPLVRQECVALSTPHSLAVTAVTDFIKKHMHGKTENSPTHPVAHPADKATNDKTRDDAANDVAMPATKASEPGRPSTSITEALVVPSAETAHMQSECATLESKVSELAAALAKSETEHGVLEGQKVVLEAQVAELQAVNRSAMTKSIEDHDTRAALEQSLRTLKIQHAHQRESNDRSLRLISALQTQIEEINVKNNDENKLLHAKERLDFQEREADLESALRLAQNSFSNTDLEAFEIRHHRQDLLAIHGMLLEFVYAPDTWQWDRPGYECYMQAGQALRTDMINILTSHLMRTTQDDFEIKTLREHCGIFEFQPDELNGTGGEGGWMQEEEVVMEQEATGVVWEMEEPEHPQELEDMANLDDTQELEDMEDLQDMQELEDMENTEGIRAGDITLSSGQDDWNFQTYSDFALDRIEMPAQEIANLKHEGAAQAVQDWLHTSCTPTISTDDSSEAVATPHALQDNGDNAGSVCDTRAYQLLNEQYGADSSPSASGAAQSTTGFTSSNYDDRTNQLFAFGAFNGKPRQFSFESKITSKPQASSSSDESSYDSEAPLNLLSSSATSSSSTCSTPKLGGTETTPNNSICDLTSLPSHGPLVSHGGEYKPRSSATSFGSLNDERFASDPAAGTKHTLSSVKAAAEMLPASSTHEGSSPSSSARHVFGESPSADCMFSFRAGDNAESATSPPPITSISRLDLSLRRFADNAVAYNASDSISLLEYANQDNATAKPLRAPSDLSDVLKDAVIETPSKDDEDSAHGSAESVAKTTNASNTKHYKQAKAKQGKKAMILNNWSKNKKNKKGKKGKNKN